jgi:UPF0271 protein
MVVKKTLLLDSSAVINDANFSFSLKFANLMTFECFDELKSMEARLLADNALKQGLLELKSPCPSSIQKMLVFLGKIGDKRLSSADISLLALASELKEKSKEFSVVSDDYSVQNALKLLKIPFQSALQGRIKKARKWKRLKR